MSGRDQEPSDLSLHGGVDLLHLPGRLRFAFVVLNQKARDGGAECCLSRLQREPNLPPRLGGLP